MDGLLVTALFWNQMVTTPSSVRTPLPVSSITKEVETKNLNYFGIPRTRSERNDQFYRDAAFKKQVSTTGKLSFSKPQTTVIFAPHPDDEILCCSNLIAEKIAKKESVKVVLTTNGDALRNSNYQLARDYGKRRQRESLEALTALGLEKSDIFFLGFPDGQLDLLDDQNAIRSKFTDQNKSLGGHAFPYSPYTKTRLKQNFGELLKRWNVGEVYIPSEKDQHPDHRITAKLVREVLSEDNLSPKTFTYLVHGSTLTAGNEDQIDHEKLKLIQVFKSQFWTDEHTKFMEQFAKMGEQFEKLVD